MASKTISGALTIPAGEPSLNGVYSDLTLKLFFVVNGAEVLQQSQPVSTSNTYSFTYLDAGEVAKVELIRTSTGVRLTQTSTRGVLPRSFWVDKSDVAYATPFITDAYLFDSGLAVLATAGTKHLKLASEITHGVHMAEKSNAIPFVAYHADGSSTDTTYDIGTIAINAYALGFYLEQNPYASNKQEAASTLYDLLHWLCLKRDLANHSGLLADAGVVSTVSNLYTYFAFKQAGRVLNSVYTDVAGELKTQIINQLVTAGHVTDTNLEAQVLASLFWSDQEHYDYAEALLDTIEANYVVVDSVNSLTGYKATTSAVDNRIWFEGSYMVALAYYKAGKTDVYGRIIKAFNKTINDDGSFQYGVLKNGQYQVSKYESVGATSWSFMVSQVPKLVFSFRENTPLITGITPLWINQEESEIFFKDDCVSGTTASSITYLVLAGQYQSLVSQVDANQQALNEISANGQTKANAVGTCTVPPQYGNAPLSLTLNKSNCPSGYSGLPYTMSLNANVFSSNISQADADAQAQAYLQGTLSGYVTTLPDAQYCVINQQQVHFWVIPSVDSQSNQDVVYATVYCSFPVATSVNVNISYSYNGQQYVGGMASIPQGATNSYAVLLTGVQAGTGSGVSPLITAITPGSYGNQIYVY